VFVIIAAGLAFVHFREAPAHKPLTRFSMDLGPDVGCGPVQCRCAGAMPVLPVPAGAMPVDFPN
jgi:hypothetical protein